MISMQGGRFVPVSFDSMADPATGRARARLVDVTSARYQIARRYMIRLRPEDMDDEGQLARLARAVGLSPGEFIAQFGDAVRAPEPLAPRGEFA